MRRRAKVRNAHRAAKHSRANRRVQLTKRQLEVALLVADGWSNGDIASRLKVTTKTVEYHRREINRVIGMKGTALMVRYLIREGLLEP
jgi:DNA-binding NarL/FixJ family response regulator